MAVGDEVEAHDFYERLRPVLEEYFDNWLICGHGAGDKNELHLGTQSRSGMITHRCQRGNGGINYNNAR